MSQRFCLFYAGYTAYAPSLYFDQVVLFELIKDPANTELSERVNRLANNLEYQRLQSSTFLETTISIAQELELELPPKPQNAETFIEWLQMVITVFEEEFPMTKLDHYYFLFGRRLAEIICDTELLAAYVTLLTNEDKNVLVLKKIDKLLKDVEYILFKMMASAALISGEVRQHYFSVFYKELSAEFRPFVQANVSLMNQQELQTLANDLSDYNLMAVNGFKKCIGLLKELGV